MSNSMPIIASESTDRYQGKVKWFSEKRGYGFIQINGEEVFIHRSTLVSFGISKLQNEDIVTVSLTLTDRGQTVETLYGVERPPLPFNLMAIDIADDEIIAEVKFFNNHKGYGFIVVDGSEDDIFVHFRILEQNGFSVLEQGQKLLVRFEDSAPEDSNPENGGQGKQVTTIRLYIGDNPELMGMYNKATSRV